HPHRLADVGGLGERVRQGTRVEERNGVSAAAELERRGDAEDAGADDGDHRSASRQYSGSRGGGRWSSTAARTSSWATLGSARRRKPPCRFVHRTPTVQRMTSATSGSVDASSSTR